MTTGVYAIVFHISRRSKIRVGALGETVCEPGEWVYVGSAMGSGSTCIENRIRRHASHSKRLHWHIDYLLPRYGALSAAVWAATEKRLEHELSLAIQSSPDFLPGPDGFGCSDCRRKDRTHLYRARQGHSAVSHIVRILSSLGLSAHVVLAPFLGHNTP